MKLSQVLFPGEYTASADPQKLSYNSSELRKFWSVENSVSEKNSGNGISGVCNENTRIVSPKLNWDASAIPSVEVDMAYNPDGGSAVLYFSGIENGKPFSASSVFTPSMINCISLGKFTHTNFGAPNAVNFVLL